MYFRSAHIAYNLLFLTDFAWNAWALMAMLGTLVPSFVIMWPVLTKTLKFSVLSYSLVLTALIWTSLSGRKHNQMMAFAGAGIFCVSDMCLFLNRFYFAIPLVHVVVHTTYYLAQWLLVMSVLAFAPPNIRHVKNLSR